jgi:hypothetical protein
MEHEGQKDLEVQNGSKEKMGQGEKNPEPVHVEFVVDKVALGQVLPRQFHSTAVPLHGKNEKTNHLHKRVAQ